MSRLDVGAYQAFWDIYDQTGVRPEYLIPVLGYESGLDPTVANGAGAPYYGIGQNYGPTLPVDPSTYLTWPASQQLEKVVLPYFANYAGQIHSGIRAYQAEFYPASLAYARGLNSAIVSAPSSAYSANAGFDTAHKGYITPADLGAALRKSLARGDVQAAIGQTYNLRPWELRQNPIYGTDFGDPVATVLIALLALGGGAWLAYKTEPSVLPVSVRKVFERIETAV